MLGDCYVCKAIYKSDMTKLNKGCMIMSNKFVRLVDCPCCNSEKSLRFFPKNSIYGKYLLKLTDNTYETITSWQYTI